MFSGFSSATVAYLSERIKSLDENEKIISVHADEVSLAFLFL